MKETTRKEILSRGAAVLTLITKEQGMKVSLSVYLIKKTYSIADCRMDSMLQKQQKISCNAALIKLVLMASVLVSFLRK